MKIDDSLRFGYTHKQIINYLKYKMSKNRQKEILKYRPLWLLLYMSDFCNLHCKMCPHHTSGDSSNFEFLKKMNDKMMSTETVNNIFQKYPESYLVMLAGVGEPLLNPNFFDIVELCRKKHKKVNIVTNGLLLDLKKTVFLSKNKAMNQVSISLNAPDSEIYHSICGADEKEYTTVKENIKRLVELRNRNKSKMQIVVSGVCSKEFKPYAKDFLKLVDSMGVDRIDLHRYIDFNILNNKMSNMDEDDSFITDLEMFVKNSISTEVCLPHRIKRTMFHKSCDWFFKNLAIDANGNIGACGRVINPDFSYGTIFDKEDVWNNTYMRSMRKLYLNDDKKLPQNCYKCVENNVWK